MDTDVIQDYAGNLMIQPANYDGIHKEEIKPYGSDDSLANSKIDWANLFIDNTEPVIGYRFETGGATDQEYAKKARLQLTPTILPLKYRILILPSLTVVRNGRAAASTALPT